MNLNYIELEDMDVANSLPNGLSKITEIINRNGPHKSEYDFLINFASQIINSSIEKQHEFYSLMKPLLSLDSMFGFTFLKPHGYAGDFELIDRIYSQRTTIDHKLSKWDNFYHNLEAAQAVRNRKRYFVDLANSLENRKSTAKILNLGSGPCNDLYAFLSSKREHSLEFECLDMDKNAINYGKDMCDNYIDNIKFINKNVLAFRPDYKYDLIWSSGLFDYFNDKIFTRLVRRTYRMLGDGGELVIGNFSTINPSRSVMEAFGQWYLHHRQEETLIALAINAGVPESLITVSQESTGVNLFLHLKKDNTNNV